MFRYSYFALVIVLILLICGVAGISMRRLQSTPGGQIGASSEQTYPSCAAALSC